MGGQGAAGELFAVRWLPAGEGGPAVRLLDQTVLPSRAVTLDCASVERLAEAIASLRVRGAPALGVAGAYGVVLGALAGTGAEVAAATLTAQRPTAVNLGWACRRTLAAGPSAGDMLAEARRIEEENRAACAAMGRHGAALIAGRRRGRASLLTHCNTGMLACQGIGTAFGVARTLWEDGGLATLWVDETRPLLQGSRLTAFEAAALGMPHAVVCDGAAAGLMARERIDAVVVGADRIAANGDTANKVGTCALAVLAAHFGVPFYVVAPTSTIDAGCPTGDDVEIEQRDPDEVRLALGSVRLAPADSPAHNPAFDVTPARLVTAIVTEHGVAEPPYTASLARLAPAS
ncbi:MAG: S-methyl-5-thioribose-1-phosphate isomerase [Actinobacteria bacterium]|nr:S-methyl-5-thioribose-1-phosphate isomerase [Actinomycetota bacterium]